MNGLRGDGRDDRVPFLCDGENWRCEVLQRKIDQVPRKTDEWLDLAIEGIFNRGTCPVAAFDMVDDSVGQE